MSRPVNSGYRQPHRGHPVPMRTAVVACFVAAGWLPQLGQADTYDIGVKLFTDPNCLFWADEFLLLDGGCYANKWAPNGTKGFRMNIVGFNSPQRIDMREYADDCNTMSLEKRTLVTGTDPCVAFPYHGSMYAQFDIRFRSNTCKGQLCSTLAIAVQTFYREAACRGPSHSAFRYPVQGECLRNTNGTQVLTAFGDTNISLIDYGGSDDCKSSPSGRTRTFSITNSLCYPLYSTKAPRSFSWRVERTTAYATSSDAHRSSLPALLTLIALVMGLRERTVVVLPERGH